jgi:hypothetical protein
MAKAAELLPTAADEAVPPSMAMPPPPADLVARALRTIDISQVLAASGTIGSLKVGSVQLGEATIDRLVVRDVTTSVHSGRAFLQNVRTITRVQVIVDWWYDVLFDSGSGRDTFTSPLIPIEVGNLLVPSLQDINLSVPEVTVTGARAQITPIANLDLGGGRFDDVTVNGTKLPAAGFGLSGLELGTLTLSDLGVPATATQSVTLGQFRPNGALTLPGVEVTGVNVPAAQAPSIQSSSPVNVFGLQPQDPYPVGGLDLRIFGFSIGVRPIIDIQIGVLTLDDVSLRAAIGSLRLESVTTPVTVRDIALGDVALQQVTVKQITL